MAGLEGQGRILDAGCGYGQWAIALAEVNHEVVAIDHSSHMVEACRRLTHESGVSNVTVEQVELPELPYEDASFDAVFCWGVLMFLDRDAALREFIRILKPGGLLFVGCYNSTGRWLHKLLRTIRQSGPLSPITNYCLGVLWNGRRATSAPNRMGCREIPAFVRPYGFTLQSCASDGLLDATGRGRKAPMFPPKALYFFENNIEFLAEKTGDPA